MAKFVSPMRMTSPSLRLRRASNASSTAAPNIPSRSPSASSSDMGGAKTAWPRRGHDGSTALISIKAASPLVTLAMPRKVATVDSEPCASRKRCSSADKAAMDERERGVAAEDHASFAPHAVVERKGEAFHPDDRRHAKRDAEEKDAQARQAAAQVAQGEAQGRRAARPWKESCRRRVHSLLPRGEGGATPFSPGEGGGRSPSDEGERAEAATAWRAKTLTPDPSPVGEGRARATCASSAPKADQPLMPEASPREPARLRSCPSACGSPGRNARRAWRHA